MDLVKVKDPACCHGTILRPCLSFASRQSKFNFETRLGLPGPRGVYCEPEEGFKGVPAESGGERHSLPSTLYASLPREMKDIDGDYTGISLFIFLTKYKGLFERSSKDRQAHRTAAGTSLYS